MDKLFFPAVTPPDRQPEAAYWFAFAGDRLLCNENSAEPLPLLMDFSELGLATIRQQYLGRLAGRCCFSVELDLQAPAPAGMAFKGLRQTYDRLGDELFAVAGRAIQIVHWDRTHQFCGQCGARMVTLTTERAKQCPVCQLISYPRLSPSIIVLVRRGPQILLARSPRFPSRMYSVLAGFVEPGETLEQAVEREVMEEVGVMVKNICYFGSQPWPFPHSLMIAYTADYAGGEIAIDGLEIEDAGWYSGDHLPTLPPKMSIARQMIEAFLASV
jgi:NAD+ diphosphatase